MAGLAAKILGGGVLDAIPKIINSIRGKNPEDAAKLEELAAKYRSEVLEAALEQRKLDIQELQMQADVNKVEAASSDRFVAGWRPFIGWVCGCALGFQFIVRPLLTWFAELAHHAVAVPALDMGDLLTLLLGMLGLGAMRTVEKTKGAA